MSTEITLPLAVICTIVAVVAIYICVMPESKYNSLSPFFKWMADTFNFRTLWLESILKFFYVLSTAACVVFGVLLLISVEENYFGTHSLTPVGFWLLLLGPVVIRLVYEASMMLIILVKNVMQINKRLMGKDCATDDIPAPAPMPVEEPVQKVCVNCANPLEDDAAFCPNCGNKIQ